MWLPTPVKLTQSQPASVTSLGAVLLCFVRSLASLESVSLVALLPTRLFPCFRSLAHGFSKSLSGGGSVRLGSKFLLEDCYLYSKLGDEFPNGLGVIVEKPVEFLTSHRCARVYFRKSTQARPEQLRIYASPTVAFSDSLPARLGLWARALASVEPATALAFLRLALAGLSCPRESTTAQHFRELPQTTLPKAYLRLMPPRDLPIEPSRRGANPPRLELLCAVFPALQLGLLCVKLG